MSKIITLQSKLNGKFLSRINYGTLNDKIQARKLPIDYFCYFTRTKGNPRKTIDHEESNDDGFIQIAADNGGYFYVDTDDDNTLHCDSDGTDDGSVFQTLTLSTSNGESVIGLWSPLHKLYLGVSDPNTGAVAPLGVRAHAMGTKIIPQSCQFTLVEIDTLSTGDTNAVEA